MFIIFIIIVINISVINYLAALSMTKTRIRFFELKAAGNEYCNRGWTRVNWHLIGTICTTRAVLVMSPYWHHCRHWHSGFTGSLLAPPVTRKLKHPA